MSIQKLKDFIRSRRLKILRPLPQIGVADWADQHRRMSSAESSTPGPFLTERVEVCRGVLDAATEDGVREITVMSATQLMKTTAIENIIMQRMHLDPGPMMVVQPVQDLMDAFIKEKFDPMVRGTPVILDAFGGRRAFAMKGPENTMQRKAYLGGSVNFVAAGSPSNFSMRAVRDMFFDEIDKYPTLTEGSVLALGSERTESFSHNSLIVKTCSPTITGKSAIAESYERSDQRRAYVACPHCGHEDHLQWKNMKCADADTDKQERWESAAYMCPSCGVLWTENERINLLTTKGAVRWRQTKKFTCCDEAQDPQIERLWDGVRALCKVCGRKAVPNWHAGFHASCLYSTRKNINLEVKKFLEVKGNRNELRTFVNTRLAETFEDDKELKSVSLDEDVLKSRTEPAWSKLPAGCIVVTVGVDLQGDRMELEVVAWGHGDESWSVAYHVIDIEPGDPESWEKLDEILLSGYEREDGVVLFPQAVCVDSGGHNTQQSYEFCSTRQGRRIFPIKGASESGARFPIWPTNKVIPIGKPYIIGTQACKDAIEMHMQVTVPGPGFMHIPATRADSWFKMISNEKRVIYYDKGRQLTRWQTKYNGARNEALDCRVYALAALEALRKFKIITPRSLSPLGLAAPAAGPLKSKPAAPAPAAKHNTPQQPRRPGPGGGGGQGRRPGGGFGTFGGGGRFGR